jgi:hypothetical protein
MPWVTFKDDFRFEASPRIVQYYDKDQTVLVTTACASAAFADKKAVKAKKPEGAVAENGEDSQ